MNTFRENTHTHTGKANTHSWEKSIYNKCSRLCFVQVFKPRHHHHHCLKRIVNPDSRLHTLAVTGHVHRQVVRVVQHLGAKQVVLQVAALLSELQQLPVVKDGPAEQRGMLIG